jgi:hypothetical protein
MGLDPVVRSMNSDKVRVLPRFLSFDTLRATGNQIVDTLEALLETPANLDKSGIQSVADALQQAIDFRGETFPATHPKELANALLQLQEIAERMINYAVVPTEWIDVTMEENAKTTAGPGSSDKVLDALESTIANGVALNKDLHELMRSLQRTYPVTAVGIREIAAHANLHDAPLTCFGLPTDPLCAEPLFTVMENETNFKPSIPHERGQRILSTIRAVREAVKQGSKGANYMYAQIMMENQRNAEDHIVAAHTQMNETIRERRMSLDGGSKTNVSPAKSNGPGSKRKTDTDPEGVLRALMLPGKRSWKPSHSNR